MSCFDLKDLEKQCVGPPHWSVEALGADAANCTPVNSSHSGLVKTSEVSMKTEPGKPRVLIFSLRNIFGKPLFRCPHFEFEDLICEIDSAELLAPKLDASRRSSFATRLAFHAPVLLNPGIKRISANRQYDILFTICGYPQDLIMFNAVSDLRDVCRTSVCLLDELWVRQMVAL